MEPLLRQQAHGYLKAARGGFNRPEKFTAESLFHLTALAIEGYWIAWLEDRGSVPAHHGFRDLVKAAEKLGPLPEDLKKEVLVLDHYQKLCEWIPIEPRKPVRDDIPGLLDLADRVEAFTA